MSKIVVGLGAMALAVTAAAGAVQAQINARQSSLAGPVDDPAATVVVRVLQQVCLPVLRGVDIKKTARAAGLSEKDGQWVAIIRPRGQLVLTPPDAVNPHLCSAAIAHPPGDEDAILTALNAWARTQIPPLQPVKVKQVTNGATFMNTVSTWSGHSPADTEGLVLSEVKTPQGGVISGALDQSNLLFSLAPS